MTKRSIQACAFLSVAWCGIASAFAFQWPIDDKVLTATFGESRWGHFHTGIDIGGGAQKVLPVDEGEIIFSYDDAARRRTPPSGLGTFVVIEHSQGIRSLYAHLEPGIAAPLPIRVGLADVIGTIGESGASLGKHLHLEIIDSELGSYVNPLVVLPALPDRQKPDIRSVMIASDIEPGIDPVPLRPRQTVRAGEYRVLIELYDRSEYVPYFCPMAPYQITAFFNGSQVFDLRFDTLSESAGEMTLGRGADAPTFSRLYRDDWIINAGNLRFRVGEIQIEVVARDIAGNESILRIPVTVE